MKITPSRINTLLTIGENLNIEFKRAGDGPKADTFESVCAFLNKAGGDLLLGVDDDGTVVGLPPKSVDAMIRNFVKVMNDPNLFEPVFAEDDVFRLTVPLDDAYSADRAFASELPQAKTTQETVEKTVEKTVVESGTENSAELGEKLGEKLGERRLKIVELVSTNAKVSISELADKVGISQTAIENNLRWLKMQGIIRRVGPDKGGHWEVIG